MSEGAGERRERSRTGAGGRKEFHSKGRWGVRASSDVGFKGVRIGFPRFEPYVISEEIHV